LAGEGATPRRAATHNAAVDAAEQRELIDKFIAAYNAFDIDGMTAVLAPDVRFENYSGGVLTASTTGLDQFRQLAEQSKTMFSEREQRITSSAFDENAATVTIAYRGRLAVDIPNGPSAGTLVELEGGSEYTFGDGKITKIVDRS
jgi:hypothetical protein